jgi:electron transfer flavoprotein beta subunit
MKILVCIKSVPDNDSKFIASDSGAGYHEEGLTWKVNEYDMFAMEEAVRIKETFEDVEIICVTVGPPRAEDQLRKAVCLGADSGVLIDDSECDASSALSIASLISSFGRDKSFDLVFTGVMSEDLQRCQTGPMLAELMGLPFASTIISLVIDGGKSLVCERELEGGLREKFQIAMPALLTIQSGINIPRYASLSNVLRVKKLEIPKISANELGTPESSEILLKSYEPRRESKCEFILGNAEEAALVLIEKIRSRVPVL